MTLSAYILADPYYMKEANGVHTAVRQLKRAIAQRTDLVLSPRLRAATVVHAHTVGLRYLLAVPTCKDRLIVSAHVTPGTCLGGVAFSRLCYAFTRRYLPLAYNRARVVIAVSQAVKDELIALGVRREIVVLPNSVDRALFQQGRSQRQQMRAALGFSDDDFVVLCVGQMQPRKGIWTFVRVAEQLPDFRFVWVGGRPWGRATADYGALSRLAENPPPNLTLAGMFALEEMPRYYGLADAFMFPSHQETFGYAVLEASAAQLPLVLRDMPEFAGHFFNHYIRAQDDEAFVQALVALRTDVALRNHWRHEATLLAARYDLQSYMNGLAAIYRSVAQHQPILTAQA